MKRYRFKIGNKSDIAYFNNDYEAKAFADFIKAECNVDTYLYRGKLDGKDFLIEIEANSEKLIDLKVEDFKSIKIWE